MPRGDGTGPMGMGSMTGRGLGYCNGYGAPGYMAPMPGRGTWGWGRGRGRGWRNMYYATGMTGTQQAAWGWPPAVGVNVPPQNMTPPVGMTRQQTLDALKGQVEYYEDALEGIMKRIAEMESQATNETQA